MARGSSCVQQALSERALVCAIHVQPALPGGFRGLSVQTSKRNLPHSHRRGPAGTKAPGYAIKERKAFTAHRHPPWCVT